MIGGRAWQRSKLGSCLSRSAREGDSTMAIPNSPPYKGEVQESYIHPSYDNQPCEVIHITEIIILEFVLQSLSAAC